MSAAEIIVAIYNLFQLAAWTAVLVFIILAAKNAESFEAWGDSYEGWFKLTLEIAQGTTVFDIIFAMSGWTRNNAFAVLL